MTEEERLRAVVEQWGMVLLNEGRINRNDYRSALHGIGPVGDVRPNPMEDEAREAWRAAGML